MPTNLPRGMEATERAAAGTGPAGSGGPVQARVPMPSQPPAPPSKKEPNWVERKTPVFVEFKGQGEFVQGVLLSVRQEQMEDKQTHQKKNVLKYLVRDGADAFEFIGTWDLNKKLTVQDVGAVVRVTFRGEKDLGRGNPMKEFEVFVAPKAATFRDGAEITDEDIPF